MKEKIFQKGEKVLKQKAKEIPLAEIKTPKTKNLIAKMKKALSESEFGVAIAASQVGEPLQIFLVDKNVLSEQDLTQEDLPEKKKKALEVMVFINPKILSLSKKKKLMSEGCLSVDGYFGSVQRYEKVKVEAYDENGEKFSRGASGLLSQVIQHETDHLNGVLFIEKAVDLKKIINERTK